MQICDKIHIVPEKNWVKAETDVATDEIRRELRELLRKRHELGANAG